MDRGRHGRCDVRVGREHQFVSLALSVTSAKPTGAGSLSYLAYVVTSGNNSVASVALGTGGSGIRSLGTGTTNIAISPDGTKAYVTNFNAATVTPINLTTGLAGTAITVGTNPWGVAFSPDGTKAYVTGTELDRGHSDHGCHEHSGHGDHGRHYRVRRRVSPDGTKAYIANGGTNTVTPITVATNTPGTAITVGSGPVGVAFTPDGTKAYADQLRTRAPSRP